MPPTTAHCAPAPAADPLRRAAVAATGLGLLGLAGAAAAAQPGRFAGLPDASVGLYAQVLGEPQPLVARNAEQPYAMASTAKLVTSLAALDLLGAQFRWRTFAFLDGELVDGRLNGDLWIVGGGDVRLRSEDLAQWMAQWRRQGLREINGNIVLDRFAFQLHDSDHAGTPTPAADRPHHAWPDALTVDESVLRVQLRAGTDGQPRVRVSPPLAGLSLRTELNPHGGCEPSAVWRGTPAGPAQLLLQGDWHPACGPMEIPAALPHAEYAARVIAGLWAAAGGRLHGRVAAAATPARATLMPLGRDGQALQPFASHASPPLPELLRDMNKRSDNLAARHLMLALAPGFPVRAATLPEARRRMREWLARQGLAPQDLQLDNGSGLSRQERAKPRALVQLLERAWHSGQAQALIRTLPLAGVDGTLTNRLRHGAAAGQAYLKTGTLMDTRALAGYVRTRRGTVVAVAALVNHPDAALATPGLDRFIEWLARHG